MPTMYKMVNTVPLLWGFLPCAIKRGRRRRGEGREGQACPTLPVLFMVFPFDQWFLLGLLQRATDMRKNARDNKSLENLFISLLTYLLYRCCKSQFSLNTDRILNHQQLFIYKHNLEILEYRMCCTPCYLPSSSCLE